MMNPLIEKNPLQIPEIRANVSRLISLEDAVSCVRVSKAWSKTFTSPIWYAVDFKIHHTFVDLDSDIVIKHGHHIRTIENIKTQSELDAVLRPTIKNVRVLQITCGTSVRFRNLCMDLIYNNNTSLKKLTLDMDANAKRQDFSIRTISVNTFVSYSSVSQLVKIRLHGVCFSRDSFATLLRNCPLLKWIDLQQDVALFSGPFIDAFQHKGVVTLVAPIKQVFKPDPESESSSLGFSLFVHFPNLTDWHCYNLPPALFVPVERIKSEVTRCCPQLTMIHTWKSPQSIIYSLVGNAFCSLKHVTFEYSQLSMDIVVALLFHRTTLLQVCAFWGSQSYTERDEFPLEDDHFRQSGRAVQLLPRSCPYLKYLEFEGHEMDMDIVEEEKWACIGLLQLRVRIRGLDTKEKIDWALNLWKEGRKKKDNTTTPGKEESKQQKENEGEDEEDTTLPEPHCNEAKDTSIEARVARHLLSFEKLQAVWLGTRTFYA